MYTKNIKFFILIFSSFYFSLSVTASAEINKKTSEEVNKERFINKLYSFKAKFFEKRQSRKFIKKERTPAEKIKRSANLALGFGVATFGSLFAVLLIFQAPILLLVTLFSMIMGFIFYFRSKRIIRKSNGSFYKEKSKAKIGFLFNLISLLAPLLAALLSVLLWW
jgi:ABC-type bacteriocin/lantibiotic exporter with double-glycine peptidase domain